MTTDAAALPPGLVRPVRPQPLRPGWVSLADIGKRPEAPPQKEQETENAPQEL